MTKVNILGLAFLLLLVAGCRDEAIRPSTQPASQAAPFPPLRDLAGSASPTIPPLPALDPQAIALGQTVYARHCAVCHGPNLEGDPGWQRPNEDGSFRPPPHDESGHTWHHPDELLIETIKLGARRLEPEMKGLSSMPAFAEVLTDEEIVAVLAFIKSSWPEEIRLSQWEQTVQDQAE